MSTSIIELCQIPASSSSLIERFNNKVTIAIANLETSSQQLQAAAFEGSILELKSVINEHDNQVNLLARACVMLDKARLVTKSSNMTEEEITFLESLIEFHIGYTMIWENKMKYETFILDSFYTLNKTINYMKREDTWKEHKILGDLLSLWETAKKLYPEDFAFILSDSKN